PHLLYFSLLFSFSYPLTHRALHSFPTRRSSDLIQWADHSIRRCRYRPHFSHCVCGVSHNAAESRHEYRRSACSTNPGNVCGLRRFLRCMALSSNGCELSCGRGELGKRGSSCGRWLLYPCGWSSDTARG